MRRWMLLGALLGGGLMACDDKGCDADAAEICNNQDDNCDGQIDEGLALLPYYADADGDGYGTALVVRQACAQPDGLANQDGDCDDEDAAVSPDAFEVCDSIDNDCDALIDDRDGSLQDGVIGYLDEDGDGYGGSPGFAFCELPEGFITDGGDCDDFDNTTIAGQIWFVDADGDGYGDDDSALESCDYPGSGYTDQPGDCNDSFDDIHPDAEEICDDGIDNNCDGGSGQCFALSGTLSTADSSATITGTTPEQGRWISSADFNGDGVREVVLSDTGGFSGLGGVYVFPALEAGDALVAADAIGAVSGYSGSIAGIYATATSDLTGDGTDDLVTYLDDGTVVVVAGEVTGLNTAGDASAFLIGLSSTYTTDAGPIGFGDFSGDGQTDLLVGEPVYSGDYTYEGRVFLVRGPISGQIEITRERLIYGDTSSNQAYLGWQTMSGGDTDGDGVEEVLVTARRSSVGGTYAGAVYLIEGNDISSSFHVYDADSILLGTADSGSFGQDAGAQGDINNDGYDDVVIGAYGVGVGGAAYVFTGPINDILGDHAADTTITTTQSSAYLGWRVAMAGDLNDDGIDDIAFTELLSNSGVNSGGAVGIALGPLEPGYTLSTADATILPDDDVYLGHDIAGVGDINGDGIDDLAIGTYNTATTSFFFGGSGL